jgi:hypothetical protein
VPVRTLGRCTSNIHDSGYKRLFSNRTIFRQLIETFVEEEWVQLLDFELVEQTVAMGEYGVHVRYLPIIINRYPLEQLLKEANVVSTLFMAEAHYDRAMLVERLVELYELDDAKAVSLLANWFKQMTVNKRIPVEDYALLEREYRSKEELKTMLVEALIKEEEQKLNAMLAEALRKEEGEMRPLWLAQAEARGELKRNRQIARNMAASNYPLATIAHLLGISEDDVQGLLSDEQPN